MNVQQAIDTAIQRAVDAHIDGKCRAYEIRAKVFNAQRAHKHPATLSPARRANLRRS